MRNPLEPWNIQGRDFLQPGWHSDPRSAYQLMFEFLRLSPSYRLAHLSRKTELTQVQKARIPSDFDQVLRTYDLFGNIYRVIYRDWWLKRGIRIFGYPYDKPRVQQIAVLPNGSEADVATISQLLETSYAERRRAEGLTASLIVSLPLTSKPDEVVRRVKQLLKQQHQQDLGAGQPPAIQIMGRRVLVSAYSKGLRLLWFRAAKPNWELWRLGTLAQLSDSYSKALDHRAPRKCRDSIEAQDRSIMTKITQRLLTRFELIAENAARGRFPCAEAVAMVPQNYPALAKRLKAYSDWKKEYEAKWREQNQSAAP